jgi:pyruvate/2-oxoglutarate/acetoin dehydrogenase E1 component
VRRLGTPAVPLPFSPELERALLPAAKQIAAAAHSLLLEG